MKKSAGILMYRKGEKGIEVFLVHPGGPFWAKKEFGSWSIPKGEFDDSEDGLAAAKRETLEETGIRLPVKGIFQPLTPLKQSSGKMVYAWTFEGNYDPSVITSNTIFIEWPPRSGKQMEIPEVDRVAWFSVEEAKERIVKGQIGFLEELGKT